MKAAHLLVVMGVTAAVSLAHAAPAPLVARVTDAPGGSVMQAYGEGFEPGKVEVRGLQLHWPGEPKDKEKVSQAALDSARQTGLQAELPAAPPKEAQRCQVIDATAQVVAFVAPRSGQAVTAVWIRNGDSDWSAPFLANLPKPWWIDRETLAPVERATIYGRELSMVYRQPVILLRKDKDVRRAALADQYDVNYHHNSYVVGFLVPADAPQGEHEVWVHNGTGAEHGWAKAGAIRIASSAPSRPPKVIDARKHNAVGDGIADDTPALEAALAKAAKTGGGVVFLPPGAYRLSRCLRVPVGVSLKGAGQHNSLIVSPDGAPVRGGFPTELERWGERGEPQDWHRFVTQSTPMVWLQSQSALSDLCIEQRGGEGVCVLAANPGDSCDDVSITHCRIRNTYAGLRLERGYNPSFGGIWVPNRNRRLTISDNVIESVSSALVILSRTERGRIVRNEMRSLMSCHNDLFGARGGQIECVITDNRILDSKRGMTFQQPRPAMFHNYFARNTQEWVDRGGNANETLLLEGWRIAYHGPATSGAETAITVNEAKWTPGEHKGRIALVIAGRGLGQYGYVADNTADTLTLARPWRVPVDKTTTFVLGDFFAENVFHAQNDRRSGAAFQFWGNCLANVVDGLHSYMTEGVIFWADNDASRGREAPFCHYNEVVNSWMIGMGHIEFRGSIHQEADKRVTSAPTLLGNVVRNVGVIDYRSMPNNQGAGYWTWYRAWMEPFAAVDFWTRTPGEGYRHAARQTDLLPPDAPPAYAYTLIDGCLFQRGARGGAVDKAAFHTVFHKTTLDDVKTPFEDAGAGTVIAPNAPAGK